MKPANQASRSMETRAQPSSLTASPGAPGAFVSSSARRTFNSHSGDTRAEPSSLTASHGAPGTFVPRSAWRTANSQSQETRAQPVSLSTSPGTPAASEPLESRLSATSPSAQEARAWHLRYKEATKRLCSERQIHREFMREYRSLNPVSRNEDPLDFFNRIVRDANSACRDGIEPAATVDFRSSGKAPSNPSPSALQATGSSDLAAITSNTTNLLLLSLDQQKLEDSDIALTRAHVANGKGEQFKSAEMLLDSGASHCLVSPDLVRRHGFDVHGAVITLPPEYCLEVGYLKTTGRASKVIPLIWQFPGRGEVYQQTFYVLDELPFDTIISFSTIEKYDLPSIGLPFHRVEGRNAKLNAISLRKQDKGRPA